MTHVRGGLSGGVPRIAEGAALYLVGDSHAVQLGFAFRAALAAPGPFDSFRLVHNDGVPMLFDEVGYTRSWTGCCAGRAPATLLP